MTTRLFAALIALLVALPGLADAGPGRRARLSGDLQDEIRQGNRRTVEVIVDGSDDTISRMLDASPAAAEAAAAPRLRCSRCRPASSTR